jgi:hypothetical protein
MTATTALAAALELAAMGFAVLPLHSVARGGKCTCLGKACDSAGKHPRTKHGHRDATTARDQIRMWWKTFPRANLGVCTGSGLVVLDVDPRNGGRETLQKLRAEHGELPRTWTVASGGDGGHYYFTVEGDVPTRNNLFPGIDLKGAGGFVVAPPSLHASGKRYAWVRGRAPADLKLAPLPQWLLDAARASRRTAGKGPAEGAVKQGGRNSHLASVAGRLRRQGVDGSDLAARLADENARRCVPPLAPEEVEKIAASISRYPASASSDGLSQLLESTGLARIDKNSTGADRETAVRKLTELVPKLDSVQRALLRDEVIRRRILAARVVDAALRVVNATEATAGLQGQALVLAEAKPWEQPVDGADLLDELVAVIRRHIVMLECASDAMALWIVHTHALEPAQMTPRLAILSPEKRCGKTTVLKVLGSLVRRPLSTTNVTAAALFRTIEKFQPTLLVDEADTFLKEREELRGILNSGHDRAGAEVVRCVGDDVEPRRFATFAPVALAAIGEIHDTLSDRSVVLRMKRRTPNESVAPLRRRQVALLADLPRKCARWGADNKATLGRIEVEAPTELNDRAADNWEPLLGIADVVGGEWPERARRAALELSRGPDEDDQSSRAQSLLADVRGLFERADTERVLTRELLKGLNELEGRPWADYSHGKGLSAHQLAAMLRRFSIQSHNIRVGANIVKGYYRDDFTDAFARYLGPQLRYIATSAEPQGVSDADPPLHSPPVADAKNGTSEPNLAAVADLSRFPGDPSLDHAEYDILEPADDAVSESSNPFAIDRAVLDRIEAAYLRAERCAIQEFGS